MPAPVSSSPPRSKPRCRPHCRSSTNSFPTPGRECAHLDYSRDNLPNVFKVMLLDLTSQSSRRSCTSTLTQTVFVISSSNSRDENTHARRHNETQAVFNKRLEAPNVATFTASQARGVLKLAQRKRTRLTRGGSRVHSASTPCLAGPLVPPFPVLIPPPPPLAPNTYTQ